MLESLIIEQLRDFALSLSELKRRFGAFKFYTMLGLIFIIWGYLGVKLGNVHYDYQREQIDTHLQSIDNLKAENEKLTKSLNILGVELEVANLAQKNAFADIQKGLAREAELQKKVAFYQQVMAPELDEDGFLIDGFHLEPTLSERVYRFELVLIQQKKIKQSLTGNLKITLMGSEQEKSRQYALKDLLIEQDGKGLKFGFKYFQVIQGKMLLPEGFTPEKVSVHASIYQNRRKKGELTTVFDWLMSGS